MKKTLTRLLSIFLAMLMLVSAAPIAFAADVVFDYEIIDGEVTVYDLAEELPDDFSGTLVIPATIEGYPVTRIGENAFRYNENIKDVVLPDGLVAIGCNPFMETPYFENEANRQNGALYNGKYLLDYHADYNKSVFKVKEGTEVIADFACYGNESMQTLVVPESVKRIGASAFGDCLNLNDVTLPDGIESIGNAAFYGCLFTGNSEYIINNALYIGKYLLEVDIYGTNYEEYYIKEGTELIADSVFYGCLSPMIYIPASVKIIGDNCFGSNTYLKKITVAAGNENYCSNADGVLFTKDMKTLIAYPAAKPAEAYTVPSGVEVIGPRAFAHAEHIRTMIIPENVKKIYEDSFELCNFKHLEIYGVEEIPAYAFYHSYLETLLLGDSVKKIGKYALNSALLDEFHIPANLEELSFSNFAGIKKFTVSPENQNYTVIDGVLFSKDKKSLIIYPKGREAENYTVPEGTEIIAQEAFANCQINEFTIANSVKEIEERAFLFAIFEKINFGTGLEIVGKEAFTDCWLGADIVLPEGIKSIGERAFLSSDLVSIQLPSTLEEIGSFVFEDCFYLEEITVAQGSNHFASKDGILYNKDLTKLVAYPIAKVADSIVIPATVCEMDKQTFAYSQIREITLPGALKEIPDGLFLESYVEKVIISEGTEKIGNYAFEQSVNLYEVKLPSTLTSIGEYAFSYCYALAELNIPENVNYIGDYAFYCCGSIGKITVDEANSAFTVEDEVLFTKDMKTLVLYPAMLENKKYTVPAGTEVIGNAAFSYSWYLEEVIIPEGVKEIGEDAFYYADTVYVICVPSSVESIGSWAFDTGFAYTEVYYAGTEDEWMDITWDTYLGDMITVNFEKSSPNLFDRIEIIYNKFLVVIYTLLFGILVA